MPFPKQEITFTGNLGRDPEMRYTPKGQAVTNFSVAVSREYENNGEKVKETLWVRVTTFGKLAEACQNALHKGNQVHVVGRLAPDKVTGGPRVWSKQDGSAGSSFEVTASEVWRSIFDGGLHYESGDFDQSAENPPEDDLPF